MKQLILEEEGQTLVEYGLLIGLIALVAVAVVSLFGRRAFAFYNNASNDLPQSPGP